MPQIKLTDVDVEFPIFTRKGRSLRGALLPRNVGGQIIDESQRQKTVVRALSGISLDIHSGERVALIGQNGSGKTTLLRVLSKIYPPTRGEAEIEGTVTSMTDLMMGMDPEESGYENIRMRSVFLGLGRKKTEEVVADVEAFTELGDFLSLPIRTYSQGMMLRLCFAVSTSIAPDVIVMDEMINVGDAAFFNKARTRLDKLFESARVLAVATHSRATATQFCNRAILLEAGHIILDGSPEEVFNVYEARVVKNTSSDAGKKPRAAEQNAPSATAKAEPVVSNPSLVAAANSVAELRKWCTSEALPFWGSVGFDQKAQAFHEKTDFSGAPIADAPRRTMVQCRQIYSFAHAAKLGWYKEGADLAIAAANSLIARHWRADGNDGFVFSVDAMGKPHDVKRDAYAHAFGAFALAYAYRVNPDPIYKDVANATFRLCDTLLAAPSYGGMIDALPRPDKLRRQNPHMHLFEASLAWYETTGSAPYLSRAAELFSLFATRFFHPEEGALGEYFDDRWEPVPGLTGKLCEPGHHFEWVWLLRRFQRASGRPVGQYTDPLFDHARRFGVDTNKTVVEEIHMDGSSSKASSRCWQQTEALKGAVAQYESGVPGTLDFAKQTTDVLLKRFLGRPFGGGWIDNIEPDSTPKVDFVPASTLYHVILAAIEADRVISVK